MRIVPRCLFTLGLLIAEGVFMSTKNRIADEALSLPAEDRAELLELLEQSLGLLDTDSEDEALTREIRRRSEEIRTGAVVAREANEVLDELWARQRAQASS